MNNNYVYDAFISYRHCDLDQFVAENLHKQMETFKLPKNLVKKNIASRTKIERVFRDKEELPLTNNLEDPIMQALIHSEYLIVVCSPRLRESAWCKKEIETFIQYHGREKVLVVLAEGEPRDSFPEELLYVEEPVYYEDGSVKITRKMIEPLAADVRGKNKKEVLRNLKSELLRLLAPMFSVTYDDLRQRQRERKMRRIITVSVVSAVVCLAIGIASTLAALRINKQKEKIESQSAHIEAQAQEIYAQAEEIHAQSDEIMAQNDILLNNQATDMATNALDMLDEGDRMGAMETALFALTEYEGITMPYTADARYALTESLYVYDSGEHIKAVNQVETDGTVENLYVSGDQKTLVSLDSAGRLVVWDTVSGKQLGVIENVYDGNSLTEFKNVCFLNDDKFAYVTYKGEICTYQVSTGESKWETLDIIKADAVSTDSEGKYLALLGYDEVVIYSTDNFERIYSYPRTDGMYFADYSCFIDENRFVFCERTSSFAEDRPIESVLNFVDVTTGEIYATTSMPYGNLKCMELHEGQLYVATISVEDIYSYGAFYKVDVENGDIIWQCDNEDVYGETVKFPLYAEGQDLLIASWDILYTVNMETGETTGVYPIGEKIIALGAYHDKNTFIYFTDEGSYGAIVCDMSYSVGMEGVYLFKLENPMTKLVQTSGGLAAISLRDNRITFYAETFNPMIKTYEGPNVILSPIDEAEDYVKEATEIGLENPLLVSTILHSSEDDIMFVTYNNEVLEIIDENTLEVLETVEDVQKNVTMYMGKDSEGNIYVASETYGYCFDKEFQLISKIEKLLDVDYDNNKLIVGYVDGNKYEIPIYNTEQLIQMAKDMLAQ